MSYTKYTLSKLKYPSAVTLNKSYIDGTGTSQDATLTAPFGGQQIHDNFYNLATTAIDTEERLESLENSPVQVGHGLSRDGYVSYKGTNETVGTFYGGAPVSVTGTTALTFPFSLGGSITWSFDIASGGDIPDNSETPTDFRTIKFGESTSISYNDITGLTTYMNTCLKSGSAFSVIGTNDVVTSGQTYDTLGSKYFYLYTDDNSIPISCVFPSQVYANPTAVATAFATALNTGYNEAKGTALTLFTADIFGGKLRVTASADSRESGGIYQFSIVVDTTHESGTTSIVGSSFLNIAGTSAYDLTKFITVQGVLVAGTSTYNLSLVGFGSAMTFALRDPLPSVMKFFTEMGIGAGYVTWSTKYYARLPEDLTYTSGTPVLNFAGDLRTKDITCENMTVSGNVSYSGTSSFTGTQQMGNVVVSENLAIQGNTPVTGTFDGSSVLPALTDDRLNYNGSLFATQFAGRAHGLSVPSYIRDIPNSLELSSIPTGFAQYVNTAQSTPVSGTGGSNIFTTLRTTGTSPIYGTYDYIFNKDGGNRQGEGSSYNFSIDTGMKNTLFQLSFIYTTTANYVNSDMGVFVYDVSNGSLVTMSLNSIPQATTPTLFTSTFTTSSTSTLYRLIFHVASTNALDYNLQFNMVSVSPSYMYPGIINPVPRLEAYPSSSAIPSPAGTINFNIISENTGGITNNSGAYTVPKTGVYHITANVAFSSATTIPANTSLSLVAETSIGVKRVIGSFYTVTAVSSMAVPHASMQGTASVRMTAGQDVSVKIYYNNSPTGTPSFLASATTGVDIPRLTIEYIGA